MIIVCFLWRQQHNIDTDINIKIIITAKTITVQWRRKIFSKVMH